MFKQFTVYSLIFLEHKTKQAVAEPSGKKSAALLTELKQKSEIFWVFSEFQNKLQNNLVNCFCHITTLNAWFYHQPLYPKLWYSTCSAQNLSCSQHFFPLISFQLMDTCLGPAFRKLHWSLMGKNQLTLLQLLQSHLLLDWGPCGSLSFLDLPEEPAVSCATRQHVLYEVQVVTLWQGPRALTEEET